MKPCFETYYMLVAVAVKRRANCKGRQVGAIIVRDNRIVSTGYNGTPEGMVNCEDAGCARCDKFRDSGELYDKCICVHAEQNAMMAAARFGNKIDGSDVYSTLQPCFSCLKEMLQANVGSIYYLDDLYGKSSIEEMPAGDEKEKSKIFRQQYVELLGRFKKVPTKIDSANLLINISSMYEDFKNDIEK